MVIGDHNSLAFQRAVFLRWKSVLFERWQRTAQLQTFTIPLFFQYITQKATHYQYDYVKRMAILIRYFTRYYSNVMMQKIL